MNALPVPYCSQELAGAEAHFNDCGAADIKKGIEWPVKL